MLHRRSFIQASIATVAAGMTTSISAQSPRPIQPNYAEMTPTLWSEDLDYMLLEMERRHRDLFHHTKKFEFASAASALKAQLHKLTAMETVAALQNVVAMAGDGHTFLFTWDKYRNFPFELAWFPDGVRVVRTTRDYESILGMRVDSIDGRSIAEVERLLGPSIPQAENQWYVLAQRPERMRRSELLAALGVIDRPDRAALCGLSMTGKPIDEIVAALPYGTPDDVMTVAVGPARESKPDQFFGWRFDAGNSALYLNFREYGDLARKAAAFFDEVRRLNPRILMIDMRENGGGNYTLPREHLIAPIQNLPSLNRNGRLYVLIGRHTFSAAMTNASDFRRETEAVLVGEPTGARPNGFQELSSFKLPNSKLEVACSIRRYRFESNNLDAILPDLTAEPDWGLVASGRDPAIEAALAHAALLN